MTAQLMSAPSLVDRIKTTLVGLLMPRALEIVDVIIRQPYLKWNENPASRT